MKTVKLGQHFLVNRNLAEKIARQFFPVEGIILEIGPGKGILTDLLIRYREGEKNRIILVELDDMLFYDLKCKYEKEEAVELLNRDILEVDLNGLFPGKEADRGVNVTGNVPYYISKELIDWVIAFSGRIKKGMFMMQKEFVDKLIPGKTAKRINARSILFNGLFRIVKRFDVQPGSFSPPPKVKSSVFLFEPAVNRAFTRFGGDIHTNDFYLFLQRCFQNRRKTLANNLSAFYDMETLGEIFEKQGIDPKIRAEQLRLEDFLAVARKLPK